MKNTVGKTFTEVPLPDGFDPGKKTELSLPDILGAADDFPDRLRKLNVLFVGAGAVNGPVIYSFAQLGVASCKIADSKAFRRESLYSQVTEPAAVGQWKAEYRAGICKTISPETNVAYYNGPIQDIDLTGLKEVNLIILGSDNLTAEIYVGQLGMWLRCPVIQGAVHAETTLSHAKTFSNHDGTGPCVACSMNETEWSLAHEEIEFTCDPGSGDESSPNIRTIPTNSLPATSANCASIVATGALKLIGGFGTNPADTLQEYCGHSGKSATHPLQRNPDCPLDHDTHIEFQSTDRPFGKGSVKELAAQAGITGDVCLVTVGSYDWVDELQCSNGHLQREGSFVPVGEPLDHHTHCPLCGALTTLPYFSRRDSVSTESLGPAAGKPLSRLGVDTAPWVKIQKESTTIIITAE